MAQNIWISLYYSSPYICMLCYMPILELSIRPAAGTGKATEDTSASVGAANDMSGNDTDTKKQGGVRKGSCVYRASHGGTDTGQYDGKNYEKRSRC